MLGSSKKSSSAVRRCQLDEIPDLGGVKPRRLLIAIHGLTNREMDTTPDETPKTRCDHIASVIEGVEKVRDGEGADLAIFIAPETYFSHMESGGELRYSPPEFRDTVERLEALGPRFPNVLLVPGSITWIEGPLKARGELDAHKPNLSDDKKDRVHNTLPIVFGARSTSYHKKQDIDCMPHRPERFDIPPRKHGVVKAAGLLIGFSICGDSYCLDEDYTELTKLGGLGASDLDVQILIARGQDLTVAKALRDGGYAIRADGEGRDVATARCGVTKKGTGALEPALTTGDARTRVLFYGPFDL